MSAPREPASRGLLDRIRVGSLTEAECYALAELVHSLESAAQVAAEAADRYPQCPARAAAIASGAYAFVPGRLAYLSALAGPEADR